jgi:8-amino-7-oxononanoate synthase
MAEAALSSFFKTSATLLFSTGYAANVGAIQALVGPGDIVLSDALNHASLIDGCRLCRARVLVYPHRDVSALERLLAEHRPTARAALIGTDGVFSMDGDIAPLTALRALADQYECGLLVDDAHAIGVLGPEGRGSVAASGIIPDVLVGTLGKSLGLAGAFACGSHDVIELLLNRARSFVFSTAPPPALAAVIPEALQLLADANGERARVLGHADTLRAALVRLGFQVLPTTTPIIPVLFGDSQRAMQASTRLFELGVFAPGIRPPTVPAGTSRLRLVPTAAHTDAQIAHAIDAFTQLARELK